MSTDKPTIKYSIPPQEVAGLYDNTILDDYIKRQMDQARQALDDTFIAETIAKMSAILKDPKHPAHHTVRRLVLEAQNVADEP